MPVEPSVVPRLPPTPSTEPYRVVVARLRTAQKPAGRGAPAYSLYVNRRLGRYLAAWAFRSGLTPNQVTLLSASLTFLAIAALAIAPQSAWLGVAVSVLLAVGYALDSADGQVARLRGGGSAAGEWLDHVVDAVKAVALHAAVLLSFAREVGGLHRGWLLLPLGFMVVSSVTFAVFLLNDLLKAARLGRSTTSVIRTGSTPVRSLLGLPMDYGVLAWTFVLLGWTGGFLIVYGALLIANTAYLVVALPRWFREMKAIGA